MKIAAISIVALLAAHSAWAAPETYKLDSGHTDIVWKVSHFGFSKSVGEFAESNGKLVLDPEKPEASSLQVTIPIKSLKTGSAKFDEHLLSKDFLEAETYPEAIFKSTRIEVTGKDTALVHGDFTLHGQTHPLTLSTKLNKMAINDFNKKYTAGFSATATLDRSLWGIDYGTPGIPKEVELVIESEALRK